MYPKKVRVSSLINESISQAEIIKYALSLGYIVDTTMSDPRISKDKDQGILIFKNQYPYKDVKSILEASKITKVPVRTVRSMIDGRMGEADKKNGGRTSPNGWGFDYLA